MNNLPKKALNLSLLLAATGLAARVSAAPLVSVGDVNIFAKGTVTGQYNSNILSAAGGPAKQDDYILTLSPGVELDYGKTDAPTNIKLNYHEDFLRFDQHSALNINLSNVDLTGYHTMGNVKVTGDFSYVQQYNNTPSFIIPTAPLFTIIRYDTETGGGKVDYTISDKLTSMAGFTYGQTEYQGAAGAPYQNLQSYTIPANIYYAYNEKFALGLTNNFNETDPQNARSPAVPTVASIGRSRYTDGADVSLRIKQYEKITGTVGVGVVYNHIDSAVVPAPGVSLPSQSTTTLAYNGNLQYDYTAKLSFFLNGSRTFTPGSAGQNIIATSAGLSALYTYSDSISANANFMNYTHSQYLQDPNGRADDTYTSGFTVNWTPTSYLTLSAGYSYYMNDSNAPAATYNINLVTISAAIRY